MNSIKAYFDGCCEPTNPGGAMGMGALIIINGKTEFTHSSFSPAARENSNNVAEYLAFETLLDWFFENKLFYSPINIFGDSNLVMQQMFGTWKMKGGLYVPYAKRCKEKLKLFPPGVVKGHWIGREQNHLADALSKDELIKHDIEFKIQPLNITNEIRENRQ